MSQENNIVKGFSTLQGIVQYDYESLQNKPNIDEKIQEAFKDAALPNPHKLTFTGAVNAEYDGSKAVSVEIPEGGGSGQNVALTTAQINALDNMFKVCAFIKDDVSAEYSEFQAAFGITDSGDSGGGEEEPDEPVTPEVTLTSISATYSGGDVTVGTAVADLTGLVVTAHYSDGSQQNVTGYTLSGEIAEGENTITVSYGGKTTTFTVTGVAESGGEETGVSNETTWTNGVPYTFTPIADSYPDKSTGALETYASWERSPYLYCAGASTLRGVVVATGNFSGTKDNAFYDADKKFISYSTGTDGFRFDSLNGKESGAYFDVAIPENAAYFMVSAGYKLMSEGKIQYVPYE